MIYFDYLIFRIKGNAKDGVSSSIGYTFEHMNQSRHNAADYLRDTKDEGIEEVNEMRSEFSDVRYLFALVVLE